ncbi:MAG: hypothetical protein QME79_12505 [Bacillota bacterium]|nr:hypothetical protein [Bacillota bacterium]
MAYSDEQKKRLLDLIEAWKERLHMEAWHIEIQWDEEPSHPKAILQITPTDGREFAMLRVGSFFDDDLSEAERQNAVCHELLHCLFDRPWYGVNLLIRRLGADASVLSDEMIRHDVEHFIDHLAGVLAPLE